ARHSDRSGGPLCVGWPVGAPAVPRPRPARPPSLSPPSPAVPLAPRARPPSNIQKWRVSLANTHHFWMFATVRRASRGPGRVTRVGRTALVTGFEPFAGREENPSMTAVRLLAQQWQGSARLVTAELPV